MLRASRAKLSPGPFALTVLNAMAAAALVATSLTLLHNQPITTVQQVALIGAGLIVLARDRHSVLAAVLLTVAVVGVAVGGAGVVDCGEVLPAAALIAYSGGAAESRGAAIVTLIVVLVATTIEMVQDPAMGASALAIFAPVTAAIWAAGRVAAALRDRAAELGVRTAQLAEQRAETSRLAVELERHRLDAELQGTIIEGLNAILTTTAQARSGMRSVADALSTAGHDGRLLLDDMRGVLGVLRRHSEGSQRAPQPSLSDVQLLLERARVRGIAVTLHHQGEQRPLAAGPDRAVFRIIERALQASSASPVDVSLRWHERVVELDLRNSGGEDWTAVLATARARADVWGGRVNDKRSAQGGIEVLVQLPLADVRA